MLWGTFIFSTSPWYFLLSFKAPSLASRKAASSDDYKKHNGAFDLHSRLLTRSAVERSRFSSFGNSHLRSALSRTSCLWTVVSWFKFVSRKPMRCFCAVDPSTKSVSALSPWIQFSKTKLFLKTTHLSFSNSLAQVFDEHSSQAVKSLKFSSN